ncbi:Delta2-dienoyl-CoA-isomerase [Phlebopus sp. FC_14]|nr:Delta2-dienoyl-CoA-isomerase [Phlebopus sp. FC_14]
MMVGTSTKCLKVSKPIPFVLHVELSRGPANAFTTEFWKEYSAVLDKVASPDDEYGDVRVVVLSSALPKIFTAGIDFQDLSLTTQPRTAFADPARTAHALRDHIISFQHAISSPERCPVPVIAAIHGVVYGLGIDIISACDVRYTASNATFSIKEVDVGLAADIGTLAHLPKITGNASLARELAFTARPFTAVDALALGLVSKVVDGGREEVVRAALELAKEIAGKSPIAVVGTKQLLVHARDHSVPENLLYTATWNAAMLQTAPVTQDIPQAVQASRSKSDERPAFSPLRPGSNKSKL